MSGHTLAPMHRSALSTTLSPCETFPLSQRRGDQLHILEFWIEMIAEPIAHQIHRQHREHDRQAREHRNPPGRHNQFTPIRYHEPPGWRWTRNPGAKEAQGRLKEDDKTYLQRRQHD